ncbi:MULTISPECIES: thioredoxin family protein [unclassified Roseofilum]|uniref:thioredoxin family protein n=1 Tax=unclassified Roseofilum TaxID=2620099 RepID=UPI000E9AD168|nr:MULTISPECIES: thioredoxin domain-containing protein [unclassified Roseofilum]MBP0008692.1 thioredoxin [Roseofilum sp. Belize Diploria]MBP0033101.1 thioredoxin [Roseofilum sp. Belize BBD 4]HBR00341.1 thiol reductase thioredoxin [Cyanobacteria bacterium UBA11691]
MSTPITITDDQFQSQVLEASKSVLVYFWANWCGPCRLVTPSINQIASEYGDRLKVVKMEVDPNPKAVDKYKVEGVPGLRLFKSGELIASGEGALTKQQLVEMIEPHL